MPLELCRPKQFTKFMGPDPKSSYSIASDTSNIHQLTMLVTMYLSIHLSIFTYLCVYLCVYTYFPCPYIYRYKHIYIYIYIHTYRAPSQPHGEKAKTHPRFGGSVSWLTPRSSWSGDPPGLGAEVPPRQRPLCLGAGVVLEKSRGLLKTWGHMFFVLCSWLA